MIQLKRIQTPDRNLQLIQDNTQTALTQIQQSPFIGGNLLSNISLTASQDNLVPHKLGATPQIFVLAGLDANSTVWSPSADSTYINLHCSADCTVSVWVNT